jgi:hypothetical protein
MVTGSYIKESRFNFAGGYCVAYLMERPEGLFIHTITRMDGGCFIKTAPFAVAADKADRALKTTAESIPLS